MCLFFCFQKWHLIWYHSFSYQPSLSDCNVSASYMHKCIWYLSTWNEWFVPHKCNVWLQKAWNGNTCVRRKMLMVLFLFWKLDSPSMKKSSFCILLKSWVVFHRFGTSWRWANDDRVLFLCELSLKSESFRCGEHGLFNVNWSGCLTSFICAC